MPNLYFTGGYLKMKNLINNKKVQSIILWSFLIIAAITAAYGLAYSTNFAFFDGEKNTITGTAAMMEAYGKAPTNIVEILDGYGDFYDAVQKANTFIVLSQLGLVVVFGCMCVVGNKYRKKYYISNLIAGVVGSIASIVLNVAGIILNNKVVTEYKANYEFLYALDKKLDVKNVCKLGTGIQTGAMIIMIIGIVIAVLVLAYTVLKYIVNLKNDVITENNAEEVTI